MQKKDHIIKKFARDTLGCQCGDEVFESIQSREDFYVDQLYVLRRIDIGNRLLIYIVDYENLKNDKGLTFLIKSGLRDRDSGGFNRVRIVILCDEPGTVSDDLFSVFNTIVLKDEKVHLHILDKKATNISEVIL